MLKQSSRTHYELYAYQRGVEKVIACRNLALARQTARKLMRKGMGDIRIIKEAFNGSDKAWDFENGKLVRYE